MVLKIEKKLVLASASPSRKMLLEQAGLAFEVKVSGVDEAVPEDFTPRPDRRVPGPAEGPGRAAPVRGRGGHRRGFRGEPGRAHHRQAQGRPRTAKATLRALSGHTHQLYTGVCLLADGKEEVFHQVTDVTFYPLTEEEIDAYVAAGESRGRAGSYGIEGIGVVLVRSISGDYANIVGLPVAETLRRLDALLHR